MKSILASFDGGAESFFTQYSNAFENSSQRHL